MDTYYMFDNTNKGIAGLTDRERAIAYTQVKEHFNLKARQRDMLDASSDYAAVMHYAHHERWNIVELFLKDNKII